MRRYQSLGVQAITNAQPIEQRWEKNSVGSSISLERKDLGLTVLLQGDHETTKTLLHVIIKDEKTALTIEGPKSGAYFTNASAKVGQEYFPVDDSRLNKVWFDALSRTGYDVMRALVCGTDSSTQETVQEKPPICLTQRQKTIVDDLIKSYLAK